MATYNTVIAGDEFELVNKSKKIAGALSVVIMHAYFHC